MIATGSVYIDALDELASTYHALTGTAATVGIVLCYHQSEHVYEVVASDRQTGESVRLCEWGNHVDGAAVMRATVNRWISEKVLL